MHLMYTLDANRKRLYTLHKVAAGEVTKSAHPARFSPDDKYSRHRITIKKRYNLLITQQILKYDDRKLRVRITLLHRPLRACRRPELPQASLSTDSIAPVLGDLGRGMARSGKGVF
ncbi:MAG: hypothetical protein Q9206_002608 [Seirophora lacunosa]